MGFRNIKIESKTELYVKNRQLYLGDNEKVHFPLEDINCILIENQAVRLSSYLLQKIADTGIALYVCDEKHLPNAVVLPLVRHSRHFKLLKCQINLSKPLEKRLWQQIVIQKITNQATCLKLLSINGCDELQKMTKEVQSGDRTHVESKAAALYFKCLFGIGFARGDDNIINSALNYGYSIIRGIIARAIVCFGLEPSLGIFHHSELNSYNLADDLIEPFRPIVDLYVAQHFDISEVESGLSPEIKRGLFGIVNYDMDMKGDSRIVGNCVDMLVSSYSSTIQGIKEKLDLPKLIQLQVHSYE